MNTANNQSLNVGVDTGKTQLDIHIRPIDIYFTVSNDTKGIKQAIKTLKQYSIERIVIEATGRLELAFAEACIKAKLPLVIANPIKIKRFAGAIGQTAKTDKLDAALIAHYAEVIKPPLTKMKPQAMKKMTDLVARRNQLITMQTMEKNRLQIMPKFLVPTIKPILTALKYQLKSVEQSIVKLIENNEEYKAKSEMLQSMPGIGKVAFAAIISGLPELGFISNKQASHLVSVAPINRDSGKYKGQRKIKGGRSHIRNTLFMAMMSAIQCNPLFIATYERLTQVGKPKKVAIIACLRKMVVILNSML